MHKGKVIGVLDLESPQLNYFTEDHVQTLSILAANLAVSLENARLYEQVARDEARLERDLQAAKRIQGALLRQAPSEDFGLDMAARYLSARELGGDLYDFLRYGPQQLGIALGDVSGKGTAAALYGAVAIGIMRSLAPQKLQPAELLRQMNQIVGERRDCERTRWKDETSEESSAFSSEVRNETSETGAIDDGELCEGGDLGMEVCLRGRGDRSCKCRD